MTLKRLISFDKKLAVALFVFIANGAYAQDAILNIQGADIYSAQDALIHVEGDVSYVEGNLTHNGVMEITGNWSNTNLNKSEAFDMSSAGVVKLVSGRQEIQGFTPTMFPSLSLDGYDTKTLVINTKVKDKLYLNNLELDVRGNDMTVMSTATDAVQRTSGYVNTSNAPEGKLIRAVNANGTYTFPLGGGAEYRYRPVSVNTTEAAMVAGQFQNYSPDKDGYNHNYVDATTFTSVNDNFYHTVNIMGSGSGDIVIPYSSKQDGGTYSSLGRWIDRAWMDAGSHMNVEESGEGTDNGMHYHFENGGMQILGLTDAVTKHDIFAVSGFTPNGDGKNDYFVIKGLERYKFNEIKIFNRWGQEKFSTIGYQNDWNGYGLEMGVYMYVLRVVDLNNKEHVYKGDVTLIR